MSHSRKKPILVEKGFFFPNMCGIAFCLHHVLFLYSFFSRVDSLRVFVPEHPSPLLRRYEAGERERKRQG